MHHQSGNEGHQEFIDEGDPKLARPGGVQQVYQGVAHACGQTAGQRPEQKRRQDAHRIAQGQRRFAQRAGDRDTGEFGQYEDHGCQDAGQRNDAHVELFLLIHDGSSFGPLTGNSDTAIILLSGSIETVRIEIFYGFSWEG